MKKFYSPFRILTFTFCLLVTFSVTDRAYAGACCDGGGGCTDVATANDCNGAFIENDSCANGACGIGACCVSSTSCVEVPAFPCINSGRPFQGAGVSCASMPCGAPPTGACCTGSGCSNETQADCDTQGGEWQGANNECTFDSCIAGSCCLPDETCVDVGSQGDCGALGGIYSEGEVCTATACAPAACCQGVNCAILDAYACESGGRDHYPDTTCLDDPCDSNVGACCTGFSCTYVSPEDCDAGGGTWQGAGTDCSDLLCQQGECCEPGICNVTTRIDCETSGVGVFVPGGDCTGASVCDLENDCPADSLLSNSPGISVGATVVGLSEDLTGFVRYDSFSDLPGIVDTVRFWGTEAIPIDNEFAPCTEIIPLYRITFYEDNNGFPGNQVCTEDVTATRTPTDAFITDSNQVFQFDATLTNPCFVRDGWIQIIGLGSENCWFYWAEGFGDSSEHYCPACTNPVDYEYDLSFCLQGSLGGVFGACCDEATGTCTDNTEVQNCVGSGTRFEQDTLCENIFPTCEQISGACCFEGDNQACSVGSEADCDAQGGEFLGNGTTCSDCPALGACCIQDGNCSVITQEACLSELRTWAGPDTTCEDCPEIPPTCPDDVPLLVDSISLGVENFNAVNSELSEDFEAFDFYTGADGAIEALTWYGFDMILVGSQFVECTEFINDFDITFYTDAAGVPGDPVCSYSLNVTKTETVIQYLQGTLNKYEVDLPTPCINPNGWISIVGKGSSTCWFLWLQSPEPVGHCEGCASEQLDNGFNICMEGTSGGITGACCDNNTGTCTENEDISNCSNLSQRFAANLTCGDLNPACGVNEGACCLPDASCAIMEVSACEAMDGNYLGPFSICSECPCIVPKPDGSIDEGEAACGPGFVNENGGCLAEDNLFQKIFPGQTVYGNSGVYDSPGGAIGDFDVYEICVNNPTIITWEVNAEFPYLARIFDGNNGCPAEELDSVGAFECDQQTAVATVNAGTYWLAVHPLGLDDLAQCGAPYTATVLTTLVPPADWNFDTVVDQADYDQFYDCLAGPDEIPNPQNGMINAFQCLDTFDLDCDNDVDMVDCHYFMMLFGQ